MSQIAIMVVLSQNDSYSLRFSTALSFWGEQFYRSGSASTDFILCGMPVPTHSHTHL